MRARLGAVLRLGGTELLELLLGLQALAWGLTLVNPDGVFDLSPAFMLLHALGPEPAWGIPALATGLAQLWGLLGGHLRARRLATLAASGGWTFCALLLALGSGGRSPGWATLLLFGLASGLCYLRTMRSADE